MNRDIFIIAARRGTWWREKLTPSGWGRAFSERFSPAYRELMTQLREVDDNIDNWVNDLEELAKKARRAFKANRYMDVAILLAKINNNLNLIQSSGDKVKSLRKDLLREIGTKEVSEEFDKQIFEGLGKQAGLRDWWESKKQEYLVRKLDRKYEAEKRLAIRQLLGLLDVSTKQLQALSDELGKARSRGDVYDYVNTLDQISKKQKDFQNQLGKTYDAYLKTDVENLLEERRQEELRIEMQRQRQLEEQRAKAEEAARAEKARAEALAREERAKAEEAARKEKAKAEEKARAEAEAQKKIEEAKQKEIQRQKEEVERIEAEPLPVIPPPPPVPILVESPPSAEELSIAPAGEFKVDEESSEGEILVEEEEVEEKEEKKEPLVAGEGLESATAGLFYRLNKIADGSESRALASRLLERAGQIEDQDLVASLKLIAIAEGLLGA
jgi:hypothetical protein